jgi:hypothetical protein
MAPKDHLTQKSFWRSFSELDFKIRGHKGSQKKMWLFLIAIFHLLKDSPSYPKVVRSWADSKYLAPISWYGCGYWNSARRQFGFILLSHA